MRMIALFQFFNYMLLAKQSLIFQKKDNKKNIIIANNFYSDKVIFILLKNIIALGIKSITVFI